MIKYQILRTNIKNCTAGSKENCYWDLRSEVDWFTDESYLSKYTVINFAMFFVFSCLIFTSHPVHLKRICFP